MTLAELRTKEVIDVHDGKRLGRVMDIEFCTADSRVTALVVPASGTMRFWDPPTAAAPAVRTAPTGNRRPDVRMRPTSPAKARGPGALLFMHKSIIMAVPNQPTGKGREQWTF